MFVYFVCSVFVFPLFFLVCFSCFLSARQLVQFSSPRFVLLFCCVDFQGHRDRWNRSMGYTTLVKFRKPVIGVFVNFLCEIFCRRCRFTERSWTFYSRECWSILQLPWVLDSNYPPSTMIGRSFFIALQAKGFNKRGILRRWQLIPPTRLDKILNKSQFQTFSTFLNSKWNVKPKLGKQKKIN